LIDVPPRQGRSGSAAAALVVIFLVPIESHSQSVGEPPQRPVILFNRWQEDWSVLADPQLARGQLQSDYAIDKTIITPVDPDRLDLGACRPIRSNGASARST
jgi:hypothetical protein